MKTLRILLTLVLAGGLLAEGTAKRRIEADDAFRIASVSDPQLSPDGKSIVCVISHPNAKENRSENELVLVDVATGARRTRSFERQHVSSPRGER
jgi:dipeptidyl aminopeptidase/acylaminoacyl peptidase